MLMAQYGHTRIGHIDSLLLSKFLFVNRNTKNIPHAQRHKIQF